MRKTTILFVCPDNALLGPLAEAYLNARSTGFVRAFSAGIRPRIRLDPLVQKLLSSRGIQAWGLEPKSLDVFLMPHAPKPDRVIYLADMEKAVLPAEWSGSVSEHAWTVAGKSLFPGSWPAATEYFRRIRQAIDTVLPQVVEARPAA